MDPLGTMVDEPFLVDCYPDVQYAIGTPAYGCDYDPSTPCPPGYVPVYGTPTYTGSAIANMNSLKDYADLRLGAYASSQFSDGIGMISYEIGPDGISYSISAEYIDNLLGADTLRGDVTGTLGNLEAIERLGDVLDQMAILSQLMNAAKGQGQSAEVQRCIRDAQIEAALETTACIVGGGLTDTEEFIPECIREVAKGLAANMAICAVKAKQGG